MPAYLDKSKIKVAGGQPLYAGISGAAALIELEKAKEPGNLNPAGVVVSSADQDLPEGEYVFIPAGEPAHRMHNPATGS